MCGIIGYSGQRDAVARVLDGLHHLEYRGYDSAGVACFADGGISVVKARGKIACLEERLAQTPLPPSHTAIGHTRWATHGEPSDQNSHPHGNRRVQIVHNGIIENYRSLQAQLVAAGYCFSSATDTEVAALLIDHLYEGDPIEAMRRASEQLRGSYAIAALFADRPGILYAMRRDNPLIIGLGQGENFVASDITALLADTRDYITPEQDDIAEVSADAVRLFGRGGQPVKRPVQHATWSVDAAERGGYGTFMEKEIHEEPQAVRHTLSPRIRDGLPDFSEQGLRTDRILASRRITVVACGTALHAGMMAKYWIERFARMPVTCEVASEFRYNNPILDESDTVLVISQSGETADTIAAMRLAQARGAYTVGIINAVGSTIAREADTTLYTYAGPEIAVASTKAYTVQCTLLCLLALHLAHLRGKMDEAQLRAEVSVLTDMLPTAISDVLDRHEEIKQIAAQFYETPNAFFIGRGADYYAAMEASLKLKEISYIHCEAYAAGELKHGTISLIEQGTPVLALSTSAALREKMGGNMREVVTRGARLYLFGDAGAAELAADAGGGCFLLPDAPEEIAPLVLATALQLFAYYTAGARGCNIDQPRNLAKSVTVE